MSRFLLHSYSPLTPPSSSHSQYTQVYKPTSTCQWWARASLVVVIRELIVRETELQPKGTRVWNDMMEMGVWMYILGVVEDADSAGTLRKTWTNVIPHVQTGKDCRLTRCHHLRFWLFRSMLQFYLGWNLMPTLLPRPESKQSQLAQLVTYGFSAKPPRLESKPITLLPCILFQTLSCLFKEHRWPENLADSSDFNPQGLDLEELFSWP